MTLLTTAVPRPARPQWQAPLPALRRALRSDRLPAVLAAVTVLLVCLPTGGQRNVAAAVHVTPADVASVGLAGVCGLRVAAALRRGATGLLPRRAALLFGGVLLAAATATAASQDPAVSLSGFVRLVQVFVLVPLAVWFALRDRRDLRLLLAALITAALVEGRSGSSSTSPAPGPPTTAAPSAPSAPSARRTSWPCPRWSAMG
ncbi:hypothetical protein GXW82_42175 [Streptacidiphilus sp. 4-A2]|nr:hypothetical protein [Streptacidiphilus sp. 4-A2]